LKRILGSLAAAVVVAALVPALARAAASPTAWCGGTDTATGERKPDLLAGRQVDVFYAHPSDAPDRFGTFATAITSDVAAMDAWFRKQDSTRTIRFDLFPFPGCATTLGKLDLADVTLPQPTAFYRDSRSTFQNLTGSLTSPVLHALDPTRKYLVYYDAPISDSRLCGQGSADTDDYITGPSWAIIYAQSCGVTIGDAGLGAVVATHELLHTLGAVTNGAPHGCPQPNDGHVCDGMLDILYPFLQATTPFDSLLLDLNHDDYYGNGGAFDLRNSSWLEHLDLPQLPLTVTTAGSGTGHVTSDAGAVDCPGACSTAQEQGAEVTLSATPEPGSHFAGWAGACTGLDACPVTLDTAKNVKATFSLDGSMTLNVTVKGKGHVVSTPAGVNCAAHCTVSFDSDTLVALRAVPAKGYKLSAWSGACSGKAHCTVQLSAARSVRATFVKK
jgi:hypothetical protein